MRIKIKKTHPGAVIPYKTHNDDLCYDLVAVTEEEVAPGVWKYGFGIAVQVDRPEWTSSTLIYSLDIRPRSSVWQHGMVLSNCTGTIDEGYIGEISAVFYHVMPNLPRYKVGDKVAQMKLGSTVALEFIEVDELKKTGRGTGAYGSTDKH